MNNGIEKINKIDAKWNSINSLRRKANDLIEAHLPQMWNDGDVRNVEPSLYISIKDLLTEAASFLMVVFSYLKIYGKKSDTSSAAIAHIVEFN